MSNDNFGISPQFKDGDGADSPDVLDNAVPHVEVPVEGPKEPTASELAVAQEIAASRKANAAAANSKLYDVDPATGLPTILNDEQERAEQERLAAEQRDQ